ncbi:MAG: hypothetical protein AAFZ15_25860 [Bacteroidota bacterium]
MKSRFSFLLASFLFFSSVGLFAQNAEKTLVKGFNLSGFESVLIDVPPKHDVEIKDWNQDQMRVIMTVSLGNGSDLMLKSLVKVGRYNIDAGDQEGAMRVFLPGLEREVKLRSGKELIENIRFEIYKPSNFLVKAKTDETIAEREDSSF